MSQGLERPTGVSLDSPVFVGTTTHFSANSAQNSRKSAVSDEPSADFSSFPRYVIIFYLIYCIFGTDFEVKLPNLNQLLNQIQLKIPLFLQIFIDGKKEIQLEQLENTMF